MWYDSPIEVKPLEIRSSSVSRICTNRPKFDENTLLTIEQDLIVTMDKKGLLFEKDCIDIYCNTDGIKTKAQALKNQYEQKRIAEEDPLPEGAKSYLQELWLELNYGFFTLTLNSEDPKLVKGKEVEDDAIALLGSYYNLDIKKNEVRIKKGILTGECDVKYDTIVRDTKCPEDWASFRKKTGVEISYYWQLVAYCYLYDCDEAYLDYILMKTPQYLIEQRASYISTEDLHKLLESNNKVDDLSLDKRVKTFKIEGIQDSIEFLVNRLNKAEEYYNTLTYEECMNML